MVTKKIYIKEGSVLNIKNGNVLPDFLFKLLKTHTTSLGDNDAFPSGDDYDFDYSVIKKRFKDVRDELEWVGVDSFDEDYLVSELSSLIKQCKDREKPMRDTLEKMCENLVNKLFAIPMDIINMSFKLTDKITYDTPPRVKPEPIGNMNHKFKDSDDFSMSKAAVAKRRFINSLIQGASYTYMNILLEDEELNNICNDLIDMYKKVIAINDYLLFTKKEKITNDSPKQGAYVEVHLGSSSKRSEIDAQGLIFPLLLQESIRGLFELFSSHGLPKDTDKAKYIIRKADFIMAEPWDMRFGVELWNMLFGGVENTNIIPYLFMDYVKLPTKEFNDTTKEMLLSTEKGDDMLSDMVSSATYAFEYNGFKNRINARNLSKAVINDGYFSADELSSMEIEPEDTDVIEETGDSDDFYGLHESELRSNSLITESKNSSRAKKQSLALLSQVLKTEPESEEVVTAEQDFRKQLFDSLHLQNTEYDRVIKYEPLFMRCAINDGYPYNFQLSVFKKYTDYIIFKTKNSDNPSEIMSRYMSANSFMDLYRLVKDDIKVDNEKGVEFGSREEYTLNANYDILGPLTFDEAQVYGNKSGDLSNTRSRICYTQGLGTWNGPNYSDNNENKCYLLLRKDWKKVPCRHDGSEQNNGLDELSKYNGYDNYGLSMIFIFITPNGELHECNTRWNHEANYGPGRGVDHALTEQDIEKLMGAPFEKVFGVKKGSYYAEINEVIANGESIFNIPNIKDKIQDVKEIYEKYSAIVLGKKVNFIDEDGMVLWKYPVELWFDGYSMNYNSGLKVLLNNKFNIINSNGELISKLWFDGLTMFSNGGVSIVARNNKYNLLRINGTLVFDKWFDKILTENLFSDSYVGAINGEIFDITYLNNRGIVTRQGSVINRAIANNESIADFCNIEGDGLVRVACYSLYPNGDLYKRYKYNIIAEDGTAMYKFPIEDWFDGITGLDVAGMRIVYKKQSNNSSNYEPRNYNFMNSDGKLISEIWFDDVYNFYNPYSNEYPFYKTFARCCIYDKKGHSRWNLIDTNGNFLSKRWFDDIDFITGGLVRFTLKNGKCNFMDGNKNIVFSKPVDATECKVFKNGIIAIGNTDSEYEPDCYIVNRQGEKLLGPFNKLKEHNSNALVVVGLGGKYNMIDGNHNFIWDYPVEKWFDEIGYFKDGMVRVKIGDKENLLRPDGTLVWDYPPEKWPDYAYVPAHLPEKNLAKIEFEAVGDDYDSKVNLIREDGTLFWDKPFDKWFNEMRNPIDGISAVRLGQKWNYIREDGTFVWDYPVEKWFDKADSFHRELASVRLNGNWYGLSKDGKLYDEDGNLVSESKNSKKSLITESKNSSRAKKQTLVLLSQATGLDVEDEHVIAYENEFRKKMFDDLHLQTSKEYDRVIRYEPMLMRCAINAGYPRTFEAIEEILKYAKYIINKTKDSENSSEIMSRYINISTLEDLRNIVVSDINADKEAAKERMSSMEIKLNQNYDVLGPLSFDESKVYGNESGENGSGQICYTQGERTWNSSNYSDEGKNKCYLLLRKDWKTVPCRHDGSEQNNGLGELSEYNGYDNYGLSMIFLFITPYGDLHECNTRWNHRASYGPGRGVDHALNEEDISNLMGAPFEKVFGINKIDRIEEINNKIKNGESISEFCDGISDFNEFGVSIVMIRLDNDKNLFNFLRKDGTPVWRHPVNEWFDFLGEFNDGIARFYIEGKGFNVIDVYGNILFNDYYDYMDDFHEGFARVADDDNGWSFINTKGTLAFNEWYLNVNNFHNGYATVILKDKTYNFIDYNGKLISNNFYSYAGDFNKKGYAKVMFGTKYNIIGTNGVPLLKNWYSEISFAADDFISISTPVKVDNIIEYRDNVIKLGQEPYSCGLFDNVYDADKYGYISVYRGGKENFLNPDGKIVNDIWVDFIASYTSYGFNLVKNEGKYNFINYKNKELLIKKPVNEWYDYAENFSECFAVVGLRNYGYNFINTEGRLVSKMWFDKAESFEFGYSFVMKDGKENIFLARGKLLWDYPVEEWFDEVSYFDANSELARCHSDKGVNLLDRNGNLVCDYWFDNISDFETDVNGFCYAIVTKRDGKNRKYNVINKNGKLITNVWFNSIDASGYDEQYFECTIDGESGYVYLSPNGDLYDEDGNLIK